MSRFFFSIFVLLVISSPARAWEFPDIGESAFNAYQSTFHIEGRVKQKMESPSQTRDACESYAGRYDLKKYKGNGKKTVLVGSCTCQLNGRPIFGKPDATECLNNTIANLNRTLKDINATPDQVCSSREKLYQLESSFRCPLHFLKRIEYAKHSTAWGLTIDKSNAICGISKDSMLTMAPKNFENQLEAQFQHDVPQGLINSCLKSFSDRYSKQEKNNFIGSYYQTQEKLKRKLNDLMGQITDNNYLVGNNPQYMNWLNSNCKRMILPELENKCAQIRKCDKNAGLPHLEHVSKSLAQIYPRYLKNQKELKSREKLLHSLKINGCLRRDCQHFEEEKSSLQAKIEDLRLKEEATEVYYPWLKGATFKSSFDGHKYVYGNQSAMSKEYLLQTAIKAQGLKNQESLIQQFNATRDALICLNSPTDDKAECKHFEDTLEELSDLPDPSSKGLEKAKYSNAFSKAQCLSNAYYLQKRNAKLLGGSAVDVVTTLTPAGFSYAATIMKRVNAVPTNAFGKLNKKVATKIQKSAEKLNFPADFIAIAHTFERAKRLSQITNAAKFGVISSSSLIKAFNQCDTGLITDKMREQTSEVCIEKEDLNRLDMKRWKSRLCVLELITN